MRNNKGFTLMEMIVVIAIICAVTTMLLSAFVDFKNRYDYVDVSELDKLESEYSFTYYDDLVVPEIVDYKGVLKEYGINIDNLTDEQIKEMVEKLTRGK